jgi:hypothetical protein
MLALAAAMAACGGDSSNGGGSGDGGDGGDEVGQDTGVDTQDDAPAQVCGDEAVSGTEVCDQSAAANGCDPGEVCNACTSCVPDGEDVGTGDVVGDEDGDGDADCDDDDCSDPAAKSRKSRLRRRR